MPDLLARLLPVDLVLVEGFKNYSMPKLEVYRPSVGKPPLWPEMDVLAVASDVDAAGLSGAGADVWMTPDRRCGFPHGNASAKYALQALRSDQFAICDGYRLESFTVRLRQ